MIRTSLAAAALFASVTTGAQSADPAQGPARPLSMQQQAALKCSAAFALGATAQGRGQGKGWPVLAARGREYFVRTSAAIMDATGRTRDEVSAALAAQARQLARPGELEAAMPPCLVLLDASGL